MFRRLFFFNVLLVYSTTDTFKALYAPLYRASALSVSALALTMLTIFLLWFRMHVAWTIT